MIVADEPAPPSAPTELAIASVREPAPEPPPEPEVFYRRIAHRTRLRAQRLEARLAEVGRELAALRERTA